MTVAARTGFIGLVTNAACTQAPPGSLIEAENVVIRRPGCVEPRDGTVQLAAPGDHPAWGFSAHGEDFYVKHNAIDGFQWRMLDGTVVQYADPLLGAVDPQLFRRDVFNKADLRGNTYLPYQAGVLKLTEAPIFEAAGLPLIVTLGSLITSASASWLPNTESAAYRILATRTDDNGLVVRSIPSGSYTLTNGSGGARGAQLVVYCPQSYLTLFDTVEVYRTRNFAAGVTVDDEMQLVTTIPVASFVAAFGSTYSATIVDSTAVADRGATLYTSPSRGGISQQNNAPPAAAAAAAFKGSLFLGNVRGPQQKVFSVKYTTILTGVATGVGGRVYTGDTAIGTSTILNASSTVGLERGQIVAIADFPNGTYVTDIVGTTVTVSAASTATNVGGSITFLDAVKLNGLWHAAQNIDIYMSILSPGRYEVFTITPPKGGYTYSWSARTISRATGSATIQATHGSEYDPPLPDYLTAGEELDQDELPGVIAWSKKDEPEHFASGAFAFVGDKNKAILGLVPTRDALFILKEDGVFRLTGSGATEGIAAPWRIDPYDPTTFCMLPSSVAPLNGRAYFLSNRGVVAFGDGGAELLSQPVNDVLKPVIDRVQANFVANGFYELGDDDADTVIGSTAGVFARESEYTIMLSKTALPLVFNEATSAWTQFRYAAPGSEGVTYQSIFTFDREGRVCYGLGVWIYGTRLSTDSTLSAVASIPARNDRETAVTVSAYASASGALTLSAPITALEDDAIEDADGKLWRIMNDVSGSATAYVQSLSAYPDGALLDFTTGACVLYRTLRARVAPQTFYGEPYSPKVHDKLSAMFSRCIGPCALRVAYTSQMSPLSYDQWTEESAQLPLEEGFAPFSIGWAATNVVPGAHARAWLLNAGVRWVMTHGYASLEGIYLHSRECKPGGSAQVAA